MNGKKSVLGRGCPKKGTAPRWERPQKLTLPPPRNRLTNQTGALGRKKGWGRRKPPLQRGAGTLREKAHGCPTNPHQKRVNNPVTGQPEFSTPQTARKMVQNARPNGRVTAKGTSKNTGKWRKKTLETAWQVHPKAPPGAGVHLEQCALSLDPRFFVLRKRGFKSLHGKRQYQPTEHFKPLAWGGKKKCNGGFWVDFQERLNWSEARGGRGVHKNYGPQDNEKKLRDLQTVHQSPSPVTLRPANVKSYGARQTTGSFLEQTN